MRPQEKKWRKSIAQSLSLQSSSSPGFLGNWPTAQSLLKPCVHVLEPTLSQFPAHPSGCSSPEPIMGSSSLSCWISTLPTSLPGRAPLFLFYAWPLGYLTHSTTSATICMLMTLQYLFLSRSVCWISGKQTYSTKHSTGTSLLPVTIQSVVPAAPAFPGKSRKCHSHVLSCPKKLATGYPESLSLLCPLLCQVSNSNFYCFYLLILSEIYPFCLNLATPIFGQVKVSVLSGSKPLLLHPLLWNLMSQVAS